MADGLDYSNLMSIGFIHEMALADGLILRAHDKRGALAIFPTIVVPLCKHVVFHDSLILPS
jgi:hypothetical protein